MGFLWFMVFLSGYVFSLWLQFSFEFMVFLWVYVSVFPLGLCYSDNLLDLGIQLYRREEVYFAQRAREELWQENPFLTTTATQLGRGKPAGGIRRYRDNGDAPSNGGCTEIQG